MRAGELDRLVEGWQRVAEIAAGPAERLHRRDHAKSGWSVAQHLDHTLTTDRAIRLALRRLEKGRGDPPAERGVKARMVMRLNRLPRGARRPDFARPADSPAAGELSAQAREAQAQYAAMGDRAEDLAAIRLTAAHHLLGPLDAADWIRFAAIHLEHHLKIVDEVLASP